MKKKLLILFIAVILILIGGSLLVVYRANDLIVKFKPDLEAAAGKALGAYVKLGEISVQVFPSTRAQVNDLRVSRSKNSADGITLKDVSISLQLLPLLSNKLVIDSLDITNPILTLIKTQSGIEIEGLAKKSNDQETDIPKKGGLESGNRQNKKPLEINLQKIGVTKGEITLLGLKANSPLQISGLNFETSVEVKPEQISASNLRLTANLPGNVPFRFNLKEGLVTNQNKNFHFEKGEIELNSQNLELAGDISTAETGKMINILSKSLDLASLDPLLQEFAPTVKNLHIRGTVAPSIAVNFNPPQNGDFSALGPIQLKDISATLPNGWNVNDLTGSVHLEATSNEQTLKGSDLHLTLKGNPMILGVEAISTNSRINFSKLNLAALGGSIDLSGSSLSFSSLQQFNARPQLKALNIGALSKLLKPATSPVLIGTLNNLDANLSGSIEGDIVGSIKGNGSIVLTDSKLIGFNLPAAVLKKVESIPLLQGSLSARVPERFKPYTQSSDTNIKELRSSFSLSNKQVTLSSMDMVGDFFTLECKGTFNLNGQLNLDATIAFSPEFSQALVASAKEIKSILSTDNRLILPLRLQGTPPALIVTPNLEEVLKLSAKKIAKDKAVEILDKALGKDSKGSEGVKKALEGILKF